MYSSNGLRSKGSSNWNRICLQEVKEVLDTNGPFIDAIVPVDRNEDVPDVQYPGSKVPDICDRELNSIFTMTRQKKGPNIIFIADCCFLASIARSSSSGMLLCRYRTLPPPGGDHLHQMLSRAQENINAVSQVCLFPIFFYS